jgi:hypothetical protein
LDDPIYIIGAVVSDMTSKSSSRAASTRSASPPDNVDHFLSIFQRPQKIHVLKTRQNTISSENLVKKTPIVRVTSIREKGQPPREKGDPWNSGFIQRIPYSGVLALFAVILCAIADAVILWKSDNQEVDSWSVSPSVLLAILSAVANICLQYARSQSVVISWWRKALRGGTLNDLNRYWESGDGVIAAAMSGKDFNLVALATLVASTVFFDGPLLQRASTVVPMQTTKLVNVTAPISQELPYGYSGYGNIDGVSSEQIILNQTFAQVVNDYTTRAPIKTSFTGCAGSCLGTVKAAGLAVNCSANSVPWNSSEANTKGFDTDDPIFSSTFNWYPFDVLKMAKYSNGINPYPQFPFIDFALTYVTDRIASPERPLSSPLDGSYGIAVGQPGGYGSCNGTLMMKRCSMLSATLEYPIVLVNNTVSLSGDSSTFRVDHIQPVGNASDFFALFDAMPMSFTTLGGVGKVAQNMFNSFAGQSVYNVQMTGSLASQYINHGNWSTNFFNTEDACALNW